MYDTFVPFNLEYYKSPNADIKLTLEEEKFLILLNKVQETLTVSLRWNYSVCTTSIRGSNKV